MTGKSALLPRTALGYLGSSMYYPELDADCDDAIVEFIDTTKEEKIPVDGFQLSSGYCTVRQTKALNAASLPGIKNALKIQKNSSSR